MIKTQRSLYWEQPLDRLIEEHTKKLKLKTKSEYLRFILKKEFGFCLADSCFGIPVSNDGFCQRHITKNRTIK